MEPESRHKGSFGSFNQVAQATICWNVQLFPITIVEGALVSSPQVERPWVCIW